MLATSNKNTLTIMLTSHTTTTTTTNTTTSTTTTTTTNPTISFLDGNGQQTSGNFASRDGSPVLWRNQTGGVCYLEFEELLSDKNTVERSHGGKIWPFDGEPPVSKVLEIPLLGEKTLKLKHLGKERTPYYVKYTVEVKSATTGSRVAYLDPAIIIER